MRILVINAGSSSLKYQLFDMTKHITLAKGIAERIGEPQGRIKHEVTAPDREKINIEQDLELKDHQVSLNYIAELLTDDKTGIIKDVKEIDAVGHRTVHGGEKFNSSTVINDEVIDALEECIPLAPLHNPPNLTGIKVAQQIFSDAKHIAVFDTAFHQTMPPHAFRYAIPERFYTNDRVRRYGFHGTSHYYVSRQAADFLNKKIEELRIITIHIGNGASMAAIDKGESIDTSMGMTPLEGLIMGTRCGDIDPALPYFLVNHNGMDISEVDKVLNKESGMKGLADTNDLRDIEEKYEAGNDKKAQLALQMYCYRIKKYIGAYYAALGKLDAIVFTAGVGENSTIVRELACSNLDDLGITIDDSKNVHGCCKNGACNISPEGSKVKVLVIPTNEELEIAKQASFFL